MDISPKCLKEVCSTMV